MCIFLLEDLSKRKEAEKIPVWVKMPKTEVNLKRIPPCEPKTCCRRNPISANGPQQHVKRDDHVRK